MTPAPAPRPARDHCPRCGCRGLDPLTLRCVCSAEFTPAGLAHFRSLPPEQALRRD